MSLNANIAYLDEELKNYIELKAVMEKYLKETPSASIYKRKIRGHYYYYKKYWKDGKSISEFLSKDDAAYEEALKEIEVSNEKRRAYKIQLKNLKLITTALEKQLRIAIRTKSNVIQ